MIIDSTAAGPKGQSKVVYLHHFPSSFGMGSNTDVSLITQGQLAALIEMELDKKEKGQDFDERMTGTWNEEKMCDSSSREEVIRDVIQKRLTTCSTYAGVADLIPIPADRILGQARESRKRIIIPLANQFGCARDIIIGKAEFIRYWVVLEDIWESLNWFGPYAEFTGYRLKNVAENHFMYSTEAFIKMLQKKKKRVLSKLSKLKKEASKQRKASKEADGLDMRKFYEEEAREADYYLNKFSRLMSRHFDYKACVAWAEEGPDDRYDKIDLARQVYDYPLFPVSNTYGCRIGEKKVDEYLRYDELFLKGGNMEYLMADLTSTSDSLKMDAPLRADWAIYNVFGYD